MRGAKILNTSDVVSVVPDVVESFAKAVYQYPEHPAVVHNGRALSYVQLNAFVQATALRLGSVPGVVGIPARRSPGTIIGLLGVLAAGGTYCPIDPTFPVGRRQAMLAAAGCRTLLDIEFNASSPCPPGLVLTELPVPAGTNPPPQSDSRPPAYILFTSGSTGEPKPVVTPRRAIATTVRSLHDLFGITPADRVLQFASLNWDTCFEEILPTLTVGATLVFNDEAHSGSFPRFLRMIESERITVLNLPTAFWQELVRYQSDVQCSLPGCVRVMVIGGEAVSPARLADWCDLDTGQIRLINTYGCTETTLITHAVDLHGPRTPRFDPPRNGAGPVPIGWPLPHVVEHVSDEGELLVGGPALALGYQGLTEATEARFVTIEALEASGTSARYFRTGDRVCRSADGMLVPLGRIDHEVKVRGIRVDPAEVETHIGGHPDVIAVAVVGAVVASRTALLAYVVPAPHACVDTLDTVIRSYLRQRVPDHLVPSRITVVPELVHTTSGKVDRAKTHQRHEAFD